MSVAVENPNTEIAYNFRQFPYFNFKRQNAKNHAFCNGRHEYGSSSILIFSGKTAKNMRFAMKDTNTETAYNCNLFLYLNFKWKNARKHAFGNLVHEHRNCLQLWAVSVF